MPDVTSVLPLRRDRFDERATVELSRYLAGLASHAEVVVPQNVFAPMPWHARWDTARSLVTPLAAELALVPVLAACAAGATRSDGTRRAAWAAALRGAAGEGPR
ncbi:hypothetical protein H1Q78_06375 [Cellulosimicrobium cellulans]|uniref:hypothetical protein n=1 Tax=Cellulosimicrobium cellulans TaxID=1710 RepID=UPI001EDB922E|nr:hypothetical protein [Cellulosimicrobium cellulans]UKJ64983.1 hypothetical protein H1Q78_06375 [Cellulosimicrobium cellulans]